MRVLNNLVSFLFLGIILVCCQTKDEDKQIKRTVEVRKINGAYQLFRNGEPYYIRGAGGYKHFDELRANGGNSIRVWTQDDAKQILDEAHKHGLTVTLGLDVGRKRQGFDYSDKKAVQKQLEQLREVVLQFKDHPALLMWGIGNEVSLFDGSFMMWRGLNDIARMIHEVDPNHPTTTMMPGIKRKGIYALRFLCPEIDILSVNSFLALPGVPFLVNHYGWDKPYIISEWGPTGAWETNRTEWDAAIEETSYEKSEKFEERYNASMKLDTAKCLGSYVFFWDTKQERTHTWYSLFVDSGEKKSETDMLQYLWTNTWPVNRGPIIQPLCIEGKGPADNVYVRKDSVYHASIQAYDFENDSLSYRWELYPETTGLQIKEGGDAESRLSQIALNIMEQKDNTLSFKAPAEHGAYRLFVYVFDGNNKVATANTPFYVLP